MTASPYRPGQFVWCLFPFSEAPTEPGEKEHIGYVADLRETRGKRVTVMALYTTSRHWPPGTPKPMGILQIDRDMAAKMGHQKPFLLDARRIAFLPVGLRFFPRLNQTGQGVVGVAPKSFQQSVQNLLAEMVKRPDLLQIARPDDQV